MSLARATTHPPLFLCGFKHPFGSELHRTNPLRRNLPSYAVSKRNGLNLCSSSRYRVARAGGENPEVKSEGIHVYHPPPPLMEIWPRRLLRYFWRFAVLRVKTIYQIPILIFEKKSPCAAILASLKACWASYGLILFSPNYPSGAKFLCHSPYITLPPRRRRH